MFHYLTIKTCCSRTRVFVLTMNAHYKDPRRHRTLRTHIALCETPCIISLQSVIHFHIAPYHAIFVEFCFQNPGLVHPAVTGTLIKATINRSNWQRKSRYCFLWGCYGWFCVHWTTLPPCLQWPAFVWGLTYLRGLCNISWHASSIVERKRDMVYCKRTSVVP